jgi:hypothetical protein
VAQGRGLRARAGVLVAAAGTALLSGPPGFVDGRDLGHPRPVTGDASAACGTADARGGGGIGGLARWPPRSRSRWRRCSRATGWAKPCSAPAVVGALTSAVLVAKSVRDFSRTGPGLREEILAALSRLRRLRPRPPGARGPRPRRVLGLPGRRAVDHRGGSARPGAAAMDDRRGRRPHPRARHRLCRLPGTFAKPGPGDRVLAISHRPHPSPVACVIAARTRPHRAHRAATGAGLVGSIALLRYHQGGSADAGPPCCSSPAATSPCSPGRSGSPTARRPHRVGAAAQRVMIGSDTLRADRIGARRNGASITPNIDALAASRHAFRRLLRALRAHRAQPDLAVHRHLAAHHGVRDNYVAGAETRLRRQDAAEHAARSSAIAPPRFPTGAAPIWASSTSASTSSTCRRGSVEPEIPDPPGPEGHPPVPVAVPAQPRSAATAARDLLPRRRAPDRHARTPQTRARSRAWPRGRRSCSTSSIRPPIRRSRPSTRTTPGSPIPPTAANRSSRWRA